MRRIFTLSLVAFMICVTQLNAQERYVDEVFTNIDPVTTEIYGVNATVLLLGVVGEAVPQPLTADIYKPAGDTETDRPLVIYCHTGNFLPYPQNGSASGTKTDSTVVAICTRLARMGYVVASIDYRLGWNPVADTQEERTFTLINAAYRGVQDARTAIRYFKRTVAEFNNPHGIDPNKVVLFGQGTGGYISLACNSLSEYEEILLPKFFLPDGMGGFIPMVIEGVNGDINGTSVGVVPPGFPGFPAGDTLCYPNHVGYDSDFQLCVNLGGAMGDSSWMDPGDSPMISIQTPTDPFAPYETATLIVPVTNEPVVEVSGSYDVQEIQDGFGNNAEWYNHTFIDPYSMRADALQGALPASSAQLPGSGFEGLMPITRPDGSFLDSSPWDFWDPATNDNHATAILTNPDMSELKAQTFIDTILGYYAPRACITLDLGCDLQGSGITVGVEELAEDMVGLQIGPNPAAEEITFTTNSDFPIQDIYVWDIQGKLVKAHVRIANNVYVMNRDLLTSGTYIAELRFDNNAIVTKKITFK
ncbi:MAG: T9SS type A sorting domain-containing protein [Bacteroidota bacterium]